MSSENKQASFTQALRKSMGKRAWENVSANDKKVIHDFAKLERMGGTVGSNVIKKGSKQPANRD